MSYLTRNGCSFEIFHATKTDPAAPGAQFEDGWYWWPCLPGCLPDGEASGPFVSEAKARAALDEWLDE